MGILKYTILALLTTGTGFAETLQEEVVNDDSGKRACIRYLNPDGSLNKRTDFYPGGRIVLRITNFDHGKESGQQITYNEEGRLLVTGEWRDGKPFKGWCYVLQAGDAGSAFGAKGYRFFQDGKEVPQDWPK